MIIIDAGELYISEEAYKQQQELANMIKRYSRQDGAHPAAIPSFF
ncbi:hypothetical protein [Mesobacillus foraminis]|nr:hypothetical protein [Mesobacillus foraminis]